MAVPPMTVIGLNLHDKEAAKIRLVLVWMGHGCWILLILSSIFSLCVQEEAKAIVELVAVVLLPCFIFLGLFTKDRCYLVWLNGMNTFIIIWTIVWTILFMIALCSSSYDQIMENFLILVVTIGWLIIMLNGFIYFYCFKLYRRLTSIPTIVISRGTVVMGQAYPSTATTPRGHIIAVGKSLTTTGEA
eukprot:GHVS01071234.1.p1 GENE.GHVS01071234.1~~GHVS01071234.1.p1  ORF type:complete len:221 (+),score=26.18 GHVS01071234.1:101-664(+)